MSVLESSGVPLVGSAESTPVEQGFFSRLIAETARGRPPGPGELRGDGVGEVIIGVQFTSTGASGVNGAGSDPLAGVSVIREFGVWVGLDTGTILPYEFGFALGTNVVLSVAEFAEQEPLFPLVGSGVLTAHRLWTRGGDNGPVIRGAFPLPARGRRLLVFFHNAHAATAQVAYAWFVCDRFR